jgi:hypothetical protein
MTNLATVVDLRTMSGCCVRTAQQLPGLPAEGDTAGCPCGALLVVADGKDPESDTNNCPAVFTEEETGDFLLQGWTVTDPAMLADAGKHSPLADNESLVRVPGPHAGNPHGGATWPRCRRSAT